MSYVRFYSDASFTLGTNGNTTLWSGSSYSKLEYSTDTSTWTTWDASAPISAALDLNTNKYNLYLRGTQLYALVPNNSNVGLRYIFTGTQPIDSEGVLGSLFDYSSVDNNIHTFSFQTGACRYMFYNQTLLRTAPDIDFNMSTEFIFYGMFYGCTSLITPPSLPATTLADYCYSRMFYNCTSLTTAPTLSATTLKRDCYSSMFYGCTSLTTAPALPATTLAYYCYATMFYGCTSLITPPSLPATTLADWCYANMFSHCTSLATAPELPATTLAYYCYYYMFALCTSLTIPPKLPAVRLNSRCYMGMFIECTSLEAVPELIATNSQEECYYYMFNFTNITLTTAPDATHTVEFRVPSSGTGTPSTGWNRDMFPSSSAVTAPSINTTYYINVPVISSKIKYMATKSEITSIATAIREKTKNAIPLTYPDDFISEIDGIQPGEITTFYSGSSLPASSLGVNGDLYTYTGS